MTTATLTPAARKGMLLGWADAALYATGTKADRAAIRRRLAKSEMSYCDFWRGYQKYITQRTEAYGQAIAAGRLPRTCRPSRLFALTNRRYAVEV